MNNQIVGTEPYSGEDMRCNRLLITEAKYKKLQLYAGRMEELKK
jgi:hypothetical protein